MNILVYAGEGVTSRSLRNVTGAFKECLPKANIRRVTKEILETELKPEVAMLVMPGGRDIPFHEALKGRGNASIRHYVEQGGTYLGLCAGAYYGSHSVKFEEGQPLEVIAKRELKFFPGVASGPAYKGNERFSYTSENGSRQAVINWQDNEFYAYFNGGCIFEEAENYECVSVLARYGDVQNAPAAIIECCVGQGKAILSGVHPEFPGNKTGYRLFEMMLEKLLYTNKSSIQIRWAETNTKV